MDLRSFYFKIRDFVYFDVLTLDFVIWAFKNGFVNLALFLNVTSFDLEPKTDDSDDTNEHENNARPQVINPKLALLLCVMEQKADLNDTTE